jgi:transcriptional regulator with XRE-family HTH domain
VAQRFGASLAHLRGRAGITQEEMSFRASLHRTEIGLLERGGRIPRIDTLAKLAGALGASTASPARRHRLAAGRVHTGRLPAPVSK